MRNFSILLAILAVAFTLTLGLDIYQRKLASPGKQTIIFASMWAPGEPLQQAYEQLFRRFEAEFPQYRVEARWDGRWVLPAVRPRFLTHSDIPDVLDTDRDSMLIVVGEGYALRFDDLLETQPHPDDPGKKLKDAFNPLLLAKCAFDPAHVPAQIETPKFQSGTYLVPAGVWTTLVFYNRLHYQALGLKPPQTWSQLIANCEKLKAAGYVPFAADQDTYGELWSELLMRRAVDDDTLKATILGGGPAFDTDPRFRAAFAAIHDQHLRGWMMSDWEGSQWPAAQRRWVTGEATHMFCGSWLIRETLAYDPDPRKFQMGAFPVPALDTVDWGGKTPLPMPDQRGVDAGVVGHAILTGGRNREGAIALVRFLARSESAGVLASVGKEIPPIVSAPYPPELEDIRADFESAKTVFGDNIISYSPMWNQFVFKDLYHSLFMGDLKAKPADEFLKLLQARTQDYQRRGGEGSFK